MDVTYVSAFQIFTSIYDVKIDFSTREPVVDEEGNIIKDDIILKDRIAMSPALAKELIVKLSDMLETYEERFGAIPEIKKEAEE